MPSGPIETGRRAAALGMMVSGALAAIKIFAGLTGHSTSVFADGLESAGDVLASGLVLLGLTLAAKPADEDHPYGHGRAETLSGLMVGLLLTAGGALISFASLQHLGEARPAPALFVIWPLLISLAAKSALANFKFRYGRRLESAALVADAWNDTMDCFSAAVALVGAGLALWNPERFLDADHYGGFLVGLIVISTGLRVARDTALQLMDTMPNEVLMAQIRGAASTVPGVRGVEKCFARKTGLRYHVDLHLEVDPEMTVRQSHDIAHAVRLRVRERLQWVADVLVHVEPAP
ncbi:MAG TPA: cation diffusion facilitator family transporter [Bryobacteraceae bacterium]|jgi:cation diffusion facilitator family transporter